MSKVFFIGESFGVVAGLAWAEDHFEPHAYFTNFNGNEIAIPYDEWSDFNSRFVEFASCFDDENHRPEEKSSRLQIFYSKENKVVTVRRSYVCFERSLKCPREEKCFSIDFRRDEFENFLYFKSEIDNYLFGLLNQVAFANYQFEIITAHVSVIIPDVIDEFEKISPKNKTRNPNEMISAISTLYLKKDEIRKTIEERVHEEDPVAREIFRTLVDEIRENVFRIIPLCNKFHNIM